MNRTKIEWAKNPDGTPGFTWNPITGCLNHINGMCKGGGFPCYAYRLANGRLRERYLANDNISQERIWIDSEANKSGTALTLADPFYPRFWPERLQEPGNHSKTAGIFVCDMSDLFGVGIPEDWTQRVLDEIGMDASLEYVKPHRFYLLTKQPQNLPKWSPFPDNCWVGVTVTKRIQFHELHHFLRVDAKVKYISFEPLLDDVTKARQFLPVIEKINWLIIGAQTKPYKPPKIEWVQEIVEAARQARIPYFLKDNLAPILPDDKLYWKLGYENGQFTDARPRQEMPTKKGALKCQS